jgi:hypothetical protein
MKLPTRRVLWGMFVSAMVLGAGSAQADGINPDNLVRFGDAQGVRYEDWVSTDPLETHTVKKIEAGKVSYVTITRTATGTYSTDGISSPNVQYPGVIEPSNPRNQFSFSSWNNGQWTRLDTYSGNSYVSISTDRTRRGETRTSTCISTASYWYC